MSERGRIPGMSAQEMADKIAGRPQNRWAAFTDEEIDLFGNAVQQWPFVARENRQITRTIESEIDAELERRRGDT